MRIIRFHCGDEWRRGVQRQAAADRIAPFGAAFGKFRSGKCARCVPVADEKVALVAIGRRWIGRQWTQVRAPCHVRPHWHFRVDPGSRKRHLTFAFCIICGSFRLPPGHVGRWRLLAHLWRPKFWNIFAAFLTKLTYFSSQFVVPPLAAPLVLDCGPNAVVEQTTEQ